MGIPAPQRFARYLYSVDGFLLPVEPLPILRSGSVKVPDKWYRVLAEVVPISHISSFEYEVSAPALAGSLAPLPHWP